MNWTTVTNEKLAGMAAVVNQEQQRVAVGLGSGQFCSPGVVRRSHDAARRVRARGQVAHAATLFRRRRRCVGAQST